MQFQTILAALFAGAVVATPAFNEKRQSTACEGSNPSAKCCATDVLNLADLNCVDPPSVPANNTELINLCAAEGQQAKCCLLPILGQALICSDTVPN